jgi:hypothetical protein
MLSSVIGGFLVKVGVGKHDLDRINSGGQPQPPQGDPLELGGGSTARLAQLISTTPVDATAEFILVRADPRFEA